MMIITIAAKELKQLFLSPVAWLLLALFQFFSAWLFFLQIDLFMDKQSALANLEQLPNITDLLIAPYFDSIGTICAFIIPFLSMRLISGEHQEKTIALLYSSPVSSVQIILGKFFGIAGYFFLFIILTLCMSLTLLLASEIDLAKLLSCVTALFLLILCLSAIGLFFSSMTEQPIIAALSSFGLIFLLFLFSWNSSGEETLLTYLSIKSHYQSMLTGLINSSDVAYFMLLTLLFTSWSIYKISSDRWSES